MAHSSVTSQVLGLFSGQGCIPMIRRTDGIRGVQPTCLTLRFAGEGCVSMILARFGADLVGLGVSSERLQVRERVHQCRYVQRRHRTLDAHGIGQFQVVVPRTDCVFRCLGPRWSASERFSGGCSWILSQDQHMYALRGYCIDCAAAGAFLTV